MYLDFLEHAECFFKRLKEQHGDTLLTAKDIHDLLLQAIKEEHQRGELAMVMEQK